MVYKVRYQVSSYVKVRQPPHTHMALPEKKKNLPLIRLCFMNEDGTFLSWDVHFDASDLCKVDGKKFVKKNATPRFFCHCDPSAPLREKHWMNSSLIINQRPFGDHSYSSIYYLVYLYVFTVLTSDFSQKTINSASFSSRTMGGGTLSVFQPSARRAVKVMWTFDKISAWLIALICW